MKSIRIILLLESFFRRENLKKKIIYPEELTMLSFFIANNLSLNQN